MGVKLMCVVAHPDDECFAFGGALAMAADRGVETYVLCLTDGQAATARGSAENGEELGRMRRAEFAESCKVLQVTHHELLDYQDGRLEFIEFSRAAGRIVERMRRFQPDLVLTFGTDGALNSHADHMMVSALTAAAFHWSGRERRYPDLAKAFQPRRLYTLSTNVFLPDRQAPLPSPWSVRLDITSVSERKAAAFRAHVSQAPLMERTQDFFREHGRYECYTLAADARPQAVAAGDDLFQEESR